MTVRDGGPAGRGIGRARAARRPSAPRDPASRVIDQADRLRAAGKAGEAAAVLEAYLDDAPADAGAGLAAFLLGRIAQDALRDPDRAAAAFARTLAIGSPRAVQQEALARRARALDDAGRGDEASKLARRYLERYPKGVYGAAMRKLVGPT